MPRRSPAALLPAALLTALLGLVAAACGTAGGGPDGPAAEASGSPGGAEGDVALVVRAVAATTDLERAIGAARRRHQRLDERLAPLARLHERQRQTLTGALPDDATAQPDESGRALPPTPRPAKALALLRRREQQAREELAGLAGEAESGRFARLLASVAASTAQVRVALGGQPDGAVGGPRPAEDRDGNATASPGGEPAQGTVAALQDALAAEHRAFWLYGVLGARTSASASPAVYVAVQEAYDAHRQRRDGLSARLRELGADPVAASPTYRLPTEVGSTGAVRRLARRSERATAGWWSAVVATSVGTVRSDAAAALVDAAQRDLAFGGRPRAFPGAPELDGS